MVPIPFTGASAVPIRCGQRKRPSQFLLANHYFFESVRMYFTRSLIWSSVSFPS